MESGRRRAKGVGRGVVGVSRRWKIAVIVLTAGVAALVLIAVYGPSWFLAWADDPGK